MKTKTFVRHYRMGILAGAAILASGIVGCSQHRLGPRSETIHNEDVTPASLGSVESDEARCLSHIRQLTAPDMGFDKAGEAYFSPDSKRIIFQAYPPGRDEYQIFRMDLDTGISHRVSTGLGQTTCSYFHPKKDRVLWASSHLDPKLTGQPATVPPPGKNAETAFSVGKRNYKWEMSPWMDIFESDPDGGNIRRLTGAYGYDAEGAYSPDGEWICFASDRTGDVELYMMRSDGSDVRRLTHSEGYDGGPFISPDGKRVVFRADRKKNEALQIFVMNVDGSGERQLTDNGQVNWAPFWHPNGRSVIFTTSLHGHENYELYLLNLENRKVRRVTYTPGFDGLPVFNRDGGKLMWTGKRGPDDTAQIFIADFKLPEGF